VTATKCYTTSMVTLDDGVRLHYEKLGNGSRCVLVPNGLYLMRDFRVLAENATVVFYDVRNRGRSDAVTDPSKLARGIEQDVDDLDAVRRYFCSTGTGADRVDLIGHSYIGLMVALYAMRYPAHVRRVVQIGPEKPDAAKEYPPELAYTDAIFGETMAELARMRTASPQGDPEAVCRKFWSVLRAICVVNPADAGRIDWARCDLPNERNFMHYWLAHVAPSIQRLQLTAKDFAKATAPALIVHGTKDRNAPYGGGRDWAAHLPNARLLTVRDAAHAPWIEAPELVFASIRTFLDGAWPAASERLS
jgi:pimeloyl-ACP methyl ester carboxylesterase